MLILLSIIFSLALPFHHAVGLQTEVEVQHGSVMFLHDESTFLALAASGCRFRLGCFLEIPFLLVVVQ